jgi:surfeit locus 1 family protein
MYRFLRSPKWLFGHVLVLVVVVAFANLGFWQLRRLDEVRTHNAHVEERLASEEVPIGRAIDDGISFTRVVAAGTYRPEAQVLTAPRSRDGNPGHHVLTPLDTDAGTVLVDRGWVPFNREGLPDEVLAPPDGAVEVRGLLLPGEQGPAGEAAFVRTIDPDEVSRRTGVPLTAGYVQLQDSDPPAAAGPLPHPDPLLDEGNHLSYAVQWFLFTAVVLVGYPILIRRTARDGQSPYPPGLEGGAGREHAPGPGGGGGAGRSQTVGT